MFLRAFLLSRLMAPEPSGGGGGGAGGGNDDELVDRLAPKIHALINSALASHNKQADKKRAEDRTALEQSFAKLLEDKLPKAPAEPEPTEGGKGGKGKEKDNAELATLRKQMETLAAKSEAAERRAAQLREQSRNTTIRENARKFLEAAGIVGDRFDAAYAALAYNGKIKPSEDIDSDDAFFVDHTGEMSLEVGLGAWLKTEQAKIYLPPSGARGSGSRPSSGLPAGQKPSQEQIRANLAAALERELGR